jgi:hypothetical protein
MKQTTPAELRRLVRQAMRRRRRSVQCQCGHYRDVHAHYRYGTECALCECQGWAPPRWWRPQVLGLGREGLNLVAGPDTTKCVFPHLHRLRHLSLRLNTPPSGEFLDNRSRS